MKKLLLVTTLLASVSGLAHAGNTLPTNGLNAGSVSGSSSSIGVPGSTVGAGVGQGFYSSVTTSGNAWSQSQLGLAGSTSNSNSSGSISIVGGGVVNGTGSAPTMSASRLDQAYTSAGLSGNANLGGSGLAYTNQTSALSGQSMSAQSTAANGGWSNFSVKTNGNSFSQANLGTTTTANANSYGTITGNNDQQAGFTATRVDNATSQVGVQFATGNANASLGGNLNAEANAGHSLSLSVPTQPQSGNYSALSTDAVTDSNNATSVSQIGNGGLTSYSASTDTLTGSMPSLTNNNVTGQPGSYSGNSAVNAQTDIQLSGNVSGSIGGLSGSLNAGGENAYNQSINPTSN